MIDLRLSPESRTALGDPSDNASSLNHEIIELLASRTSVAESELMSAFQQYADILSERLSVLTRLGFLSTEAQTTNRIYRLSKLGEYAHSKTYFSLD